MHIRRVRIDDDAMRRYVEELWIPYNRDLCDVDNERARAFYEKLGFGTYRRKMGVAVEEVETDK
jgi:ribosomal protein S18 acetylase RimI-like enzyme